MLSASVETYTETDEQLAQALQVNDENGGGGPAASRAE
jgi:hypothetical protein